MLKPCLFNDKDPIANVRFLGPFKRSCDSNEVSEVITLWILSNFSIEGPRASLSKLIVPTGVGLDAYALPRAGGYEIDTCVDAVNQQLKFLLPMQIMPGLHLRLVGSERCPTSLRKSLQIQSTLRQSDVEMHIPMNESRKYL